jgi:hypothetical protein
MQVYLADIIGTAGKSSWNKKCLWEVTHFKMTVVFLIRHPKLNSISDD